ncbi:MAG: hydrogen peroxide-inducible genes activator [Bdellovibrionales bacterium]|nr:hydrogen peroxide-inducible genes activator [Bdellovibrionales bacterium]
MASITQLEYLIAVDKHRHFGKAAKECSVSQPTLSMQLHKMEEEYGVTFFDRSKQPILPNPEAVPLIEQAKTILREYQKLKHLTVDQVGEPSGEFKLGVIPTVAPYLIPHFLGDFANQNPKVSLSVREMTTSQIIEALDRDEIDAGILATPLNIMSLDERPLYYEPFYVFTSLNHPLAKLKTINEDDLTTNGIWLLSEGHCLRNQVVKLCSTRKASAVFKNVSFESGSMETIVQLVEQGHGYTLLPAMATDRLAREKSPGLKEIRSPTPTREISLVYRRSQYKQNILKALSETVKAHLPKNVYAKRNSDMSIVQIK